jgi:hypothetical protein
MERELSSLAFHLTKNLHLCQVLVNCHVLIIYINQILYGYFYKIYLRNNLFEILITKK